MLEAKVVVVVVVALDGVQGPKCQWTRLELFFLLCNSLSMPLLSSPLVVSVSAVRNGEWAMARGSQGFHREGP